MDICLLTINEQYESVLGLNTNSENIDKHKILHVSLGLGYDVGLHCSVSEPDCKNQLVMLVSQSLKRLLYPLL